jgi:hypothetical protein
MMGLAFTCDGRSVPRRPAFAEEDGAAIFVSEEYERATYKSKIKIPALCKVFDIRSINCATTSRAQTPISRRALDLPNHPQSLRPV